jgi:ABC-type antimicrobial peptide transport system permease subunit
MSNIDLFLMGIKNLWRRKLRTFLTVLGVVIGATSIIVMLSLGFGISKANEDQIASMGSLTTITIHEGYGGGMYMDGSMGGSAEEKILDDKAIATFKAMKNVTAVTPLLETYGILVAGRYQNHLQIRGIDPDAMEAFEYDKLQEGQLLSSTDDMSAVFGAWVADSFWDPKSRGPYREIDVDLMKDRMFLTFDPNYGFDSMPGMGGMPGEKKVVYKQYKLKPAGIFEEGNNETDWYTYMPLHTVQKLIQEKEKAEGIKPQPGRKQDKGYSQVLVKVNDIKNVQEIQQTIKDMGYNAYSLNDWLEEMKKSAGIIQAVLGGIGAISLLVAAIGIANTMVMSIYERTREIGVMKVIGASLKDIKRLFLFESALIGLLGGVLGVGLSLLLSFIANKFGGSFLGNMGVGPDSKISIIPLWLIFASMGFSAVIGVISGYFPARRAMNLSALDAIRSE